MHGKVRKLFESRAKAETELQRLQEKVQDAVENKDRCVRIERHVTSCDEAMTNMFAKHELQVTPQTLQFRTQTLLPLLLQCQNRSTWGLLQQPHHLAFQ